MPNLWEFVQFSRGCSRTQTHHNLQEGLFQIASQTCNILVQVNNTNNFNYESNSTNFHFNNCTEPSGFKDKDTSTVINTQTNKPNSIYDIEQCSVLLPTTLGESMSKEKYIQRYSNKQLFAKNYNNKKHRLSVSYFNLYFFVSHAMAFSWKF